MQKRMTLIHALSPLHAGVGQGLGVIDLPIAREKATNLPYLPGSSLKGVLRSLCEGDGAKRSLFGPDTANADDYASPVQFSDQILLFLPVRSLAGTFAYITCPWVLQRFRRDFQAIHPNKPILANLPAQQEERILLANGSAIAWQNGNTNRVVFEDLDFQCEENTAANALADALKGLIFPDDPEAQESFKKRFAIVSDNNFNYLVETATQVNARIRLKDECKTVVKGALWYEESLPAESVLWGIALVENIPKAGLSPEQGIAKIREILSVNKILQIGGKATVGRGLCRVQLAEV